jgi:lipopolysaccharide biosynthesis glycosyltransferase
MDTTAGTRTLHLACAARHDYVPHTAAMLHSALGQAGGLQVHIHFLHGPDMPRSYPSLLEEMVQCLGERISFRLISEEDVAGLRTRTLLPASHWYRIFLPELLPDLDRVLYLDGDIIVLDSLGPLWETPFDGNYLGAVSNVFEQHDSHRPASLGLPETQHYFNSGVLLMNLDAMRRDGCTAELVAYATKNAELLAWPEQDALNVLLGDRRLALHPRWNLMNSILLFPWAADILGAEAVEEARRNPAVRHFEGPSVNKPWHYLCDRGMRDLYFEHRRETPWPDYELEGRTPGNVLRRAGRRLRGPRRAGEPSST